MISNHQKSHSICIAPMLSYTDRHFRYLMRFITKNAFLYTEMVVAQALLYKDPSRWLAFNKEEHPVALQLAGNKPSILANGAKLGERFGYDEINLNVGCPSPRVKAGQFGCSLLQWSQLVADCFKAMQDAVTVPVTIKTRIGILEESVESAGGIIHWQKTMYQRLAEFIDSLMHVGCKTFIIHARWADLRRLSPRQNRTIPSLHYEIVYQLKKDFPALEIILNGGIKAVDNYQIQLQKLLIDGVMIGQAAYRDPYYFINLDEVFYNDKHPKLTREDILEEYLLYVEKQARKGFSKKYMKRHLPNLFRRIPDAKKWRKEYLN